MIEIKYQIIISSTYKDLIEERSAAIKTICGTFSIECEVICEELLKPIRSSFSVVVE